MRNKYENLLGAFLALRAKNRAFRSNSSDLLMQILWDFRYNPLRGPRGFQDMNRR
jgi:hypothetical protein